MAVQAQNLAFVLHSRTHGQSLYHEYAISQAYCILNASVTRHVSN